MIIKQSTPVLLVCSVLGVSAGGILNSSLETLLTNPTLLTLLAFFLGSCDDGKEVSPITGSGGTPFNPAFPIRIDSI